MFYNCVVLILFSLHRLATIKDLVLGRQLMTVLLKLFGFVVNVKACRQELIKTEMNTVNVMLGALNLALWAEQESGTSTKGQTITEQILHIMEVILLEASSQDPEIYTVRYSRIRPKNLDQFTFNLSLTLTKGKYCGKTRLRLKDKKPFKIVWLQGQDKQV